MFTYGQGNVLPAEFLEQEISTLPHLERTERMQKHISRSDSEKGRAIWEGVSKAAERCPDWVRPQVQKAAVAALPGVTPPCSA